MHALDDLDAVHPSVDIHQGVDQDRTGQPGATRDLRDLVPRGLVGHRQAGLVEDVLAVHHER